MFGALHHADLAMIKLKNLSSQLVSNLASADVLTKSKRDLILSILKSTTTKREARNYLRKYQKQFEDNRYFCRSSHSIKSLSNLQSQRELFVSRFLQGLNPFVGIYPDEDTKLEKIPLRIAIIQLEATDESNQNWSGAAESLKRLIKLGISPVLYLHRKSHPNSDFKSCARVLSKEANQLLHFLSDPSSEELSVSSTIIGSLFEKNAGNTTMASLEQLLIPLYQGIVPIVQSIVYDTESATQSLVPSKDGLVAMCTRLLHNLHLLSLEKIIIIDDLGGIPSIERDKSSHVFINLSQEYEDIVSELHIGFLDSEARDQHLENLNLMRTVLDMATKLSGDRETTGIITTPSIMSLNDDELNPIIYNVLTDRPIISSSLPLGQTRTPHLSTSILKDGYQVLVADKNLCDTPLSFKSLVASKVIDEHKLFELMEDSFQRELDTQAYVRRINDKLASIIIVGEYDGAAIITWETLPNGEKVAYLDKFAVSSKNQGLPSLADIIFKLICRSHGKELLWRSRKDNPVNKWYFERCRGSFSLKNSSWKLFYTGDIFERRINYRTEGILLDLNRKLEMFAELVEKIEPSFR